MDINKLQYISLCQKVGQELEIHIGIKDKCLIEFIIDIAKQAKDQKQFLKLLEENGAEFSHQFCNSLYILIKKMLPQEIQKVAFLDEQPNNLQNNTQNLIQDQNQLRKQFPSLALQNKDEIQLDLDLDSPIKNLENKLDITKKTNLTQKEEKNNKQQQDQKEKRFKRSQSRDEVKNRKQEKYRSRSRSRDKDKKHKRKYNEEKQEKRKNYRELIENQIYEGLVSRVMEYGCFIKLIECENREGLCHISNMVRNQRERKNAIDLIQQGESVKVLVKKIEGNRIQLSIKDCEQVRKEEIVQKYQVQSNGIGLLTGIKIDEKEEEVQQKTVKRMTSPELWEQSRLRYNNMWEDEVEDEIDQQGNINQKNDDLDIELNDKEAPFLRGQTAKAGIQLSPVRIIKNPEGSLQREAINAIQAVKDRREMRETQQRALLENMPKDFSKYWDDPNAEAGTRTLAGTLRGLGQQIQDQLPEWKKDNSIFSKGIQFNSRSLISMIEQKKQLPIYQFREDLIKAIQNHQILIVIGETGSGKTTQITQYLLEAGLCMQGTKIGCTQPRRVAAMSVAKRVAEEMNVVLGEEVGYSIRFEDCTSNKTIIKYMTDGMLLREALIDKEMSNYSCIMLDEAHERTVHTDVLFGLMKKIIQKRPDFRLIVTSATLDAEKFSNYFFNCNIFRIPGRTFPVEILYTNQPESDYLDAALTTVLQIHLVEPKGDILLFLTGQEEIDTACQILYERMKKIGDEAPELIILPVYSALPSEMQTRIFDQAPMGTRKVIIATNIAEASLTIDGIFYVVDPGFAKIKVYNPKLGMDTLVVAPISQASARQRAGRAGRTGPGKCYRLYTETAYKHEMLQVTVPEIQRTNLANTVLLLKAMGINDLLSFDFMDPPPVQSLIAALETLYALNSLDDEGFLSKLGRKMAEFPLEPQLSKMLLTSVDLQCSDEIISIIAMLSVQNVFYRPKDKQAIADQKRAKFHQMEGDHLTLLNVYEQWKHNNFSNVWCHENFIQYRAMRRAQDIRKQLLTLMDRYRYPIVSCNKQYWKCRKSITAGFFAHAAKKDPNEGYRTLIDNQLVYIHPSSALFNKSADWVVYHELVLTTKEYQREVTQIDYHWLVQVAPNFFKYSDLASISKRKKNEKIEPLFQKNEEKDAWRLSRRKG